MRIVWEESEMERAYNTARAEPAPPLKRRRLRGKFVEEPRHIEIQVAGDQYGNVPPERTVTVPSSVGIRNFRGGITFSVCMTDELRYKMGEAKKAASAINYESVGTVEFLTLTNTGTSTSWR